MRMIRRTGMTAFIIVWIGQMISLLGSQMTVYALSYWAYSVTQQVTSLALMTFFGLGASILFSPIAGVLVDRWNRKLTMMLSDLVGGLSILTLLILHISGALHLWHMYALSTMMGIFQAFQFPAHTAATSTILPKAQYVRAVGITTTASSLAGILSPIIAGILLYRIGINGIFAIDVLSFAFAIAALFAVHIPPVAPGESPSEKRSSFWKDVSFGFRYIFARPSLLALQGFLFTTNLFFSLVHSIQSGMILARTANNAAVLSSLLSAQAAGGLAGGVLLSLWGRFNHKITTLLWAVIAQGIFGFFLLGIGQNPLVITIAGFLSFLCIPFIHGCNQAIWQAKVPPNMQGRVFAARRQIAQIAIPFSALITGPLADRIFEPALRPSGSLVPLVGWLVGIGPGAGIGLMFVLVGVAYVLIGFLGYAVQPIRYAEELLPDYDADLGARSNMNA